MDYFSPSKIWASAPQGAEQWRNALVFALGVLLGWLTSPLVWVVAGPFRAVALLLGQCRQENSYQTSGCGDAGESCGMSQFKLDTIESLGGDDDDRGSAFWTGYYSVKMVNRALSENAQWFAIAIPIYGYAVVRTLWTHGWGYSSPISVAWARKGPGGITNGYVESYAWSGFVFWRSLSLLPAAAVVWAIYKFVPRKVK
jgi:hypothetical protein